MSSDSLSRCPSTLVNGSQGISHLHHCVLIGQRGLPSATDLYRWSLWEDVCCSSRGSLCQYWSPAFALNWTKPPRESRPWPMRSRAGLDRCIHASIDRVSIWPVKWFSQWPFLINGLKMTANTQVTHKNSSPSVSKGQYWSLWNISSYLTLVRQVSSKTN